MYSLVWKTNTKPFRIKTVQGLLAEIGLGYLLPNPGVPLLVCCIHVINPPPQILTPKRMSTFPELPPHNKQVARAHYTRCCSCNVPFFGISILGKQTYLPSHAPASPFQGLPASTTTRAHPAHLPGMHYRTQENRAFSKRSRATKWFVKRPLFWTILEAIQLLRGPGAWLCGDSAKVGSSWHPGIHARCISDGSALSLGLGQPHGLFFPV